ncbi:hypothetical protein [Mesorhizobium sp. Pch-S]|uniref:hypothetical protein n=1 Tax=Mesorhizobium sp. Pch-S TaxID=2082387 RepID=UPI001012FC01|nr:hypothetical protein [Mesorhizobium sp. Pch-S]QAZ45985.1 hypothetical protein C1M53_26745 [Mesorhizobium sp. Pch-S]
MKFHLPEITYPLSIGTIGIILATGHEIMAHCCTNGCRHDGRLNLVRIAKKSPLGLGQGTLRHEILPYVFCPVCREAGRDDKNLTFTLCTPEAHCRWPKAEHDRNEAAKRARGGEN